MTSDRRTVLSGLGAAAAAVAFGSAPARAQARGAFAPAHHAPDEWLDAVPGKHRVFIDTSSSEGVADGLQYASTLFAANKSGYGLEDADLAIVVCLRHLGTSFAFNNAMWAKYGKTLAEVGKYTNPRGGEAPAANPHLGSGGRGIEGLAKRGVQFVICDMATHRIAGQIATAVGGDTDTLYKELVANPVPNGHFMAAGIVGATRAQEYGYSLLVAG
jgi:hypothetical protein